MRHLLLILTLFILSNSNSYSKNGIEESIVQKIAAISSTNNFATIRDFAPSDSIIKNTPQLFRYCFDNSWEKKLIFSFTNFKNTYPGFNASQLSILSKYELYPNATDFNKITLSLVTPTDGSESAALKSVMGKAEIIIIRGKAYLYDLELYGIDINESRKNLKAFESKTIIEPAVGLFISGINTNRNINPLIIPKSAILIGFQNCQETKSSPASQFEVQYNNIVANINQNIKTLTSALQSQDKVTLESIDEFSKKDVQCFDYEQKITFTLKTSAGNRFQIKIKLIEYECSYLITDVKTINLN